LPRTLWVTSLFQAGSVRTFWTFWTFSTIYEVAHVSEH